MLEKLLAPPIWRPVNICTALTFRNALVSKRKALWSWKVKHKYKFSTSYAWGRDKTFSGSLDLDMRIT